MLSLGITLERPSPAELAGRRISVDVPTVTGDSFRIRLNGKMANQRRLAGRAVRVGIEFDQPFEAGLGTTILESTMSDEDTEAGVRRSRSRHLAVFPNKVNSRQWSPGVRPLAAQVLPISFH